MRHDMTCATCGRTWNDLETPTPSGRCPFEYDHVDEAQEPTYSWRVSEEHETFGPGETAEIYRLMFHEVQGVYDVTIAVVHVDDAVQLTRRLNTTSEEN